MHPCPPTQHGCDPAWRRATHPLLRRLRLVSAHVRARRLMTTGTLLTTRAPCYGGVRNTSIVIHVCAGYGVQAQCTQRTKKKKHIVLNLFFSPRRGRQCIICCRRPVFHGTCDATPAPRTKHQDAYTKKKIKVKEDNQNKANVAAACGVLKNHLLVDIRIGKTSASN